MDKIVLANSKEDIDIARDLFREYEEWLGLDLCFQGFEAELASLPGKYARPDGRLFLAYSDNVPAGCIALRKLGDGVCEMKRLFVRNDFQGRGIGVALIQTLISSARDAGYRSMRLDTYPAKMSKAVGLYHSVGFIEIVPYYDNPYDGVVFMELVL